MAKSSNAQTALKFAEDIFKTTESWAAFWNALFGIQGKISELFPTQSKRVEFSKTSEYSRIIEMLEELQTTDDSTPVADASGKVFVRAPKSLHAALIAEAEAEGVSLNQLCVAKLSMQLRASV